MASRGGNKRDACGSYDLGVVASWRQELWCKQWQASQSDGPALVVDCKELRGLAVEALGDLPPLTPGGFLQAASEIAKLTAVGVDAIAPSVLVALPVAGMEELVQIYQGVEQAFA